MKTFQQLKANDEWHPCGGYWRFRIGTLFTNRHVSSRQGILPNLCSSRRFSKDSNSHTFRTFRLLMDYFWPVQNGANHLGIHPLWMNGFLFCLFGWCCGHLLHRWRVFATSRMHFQCFFHHDLALNVEKCKFLQSQTKFLGHSIIPDGGPRRGTNFLLSKPAKHLWKFLGAVNDCLPDQSHSSSLWSPETVHALLAFPQQN